MPVELKIPEVGESIAEVQIAQWLKAEGDMVKADESVAVIDSEKTTFELSAPKSGRLAKILRPAGQTARVGEVVGQIEPDGEGNEKQSPEKKPEPPAKPEAAEPVRDKKAVEKRSKPDKAKPVAPVPAESGEDAKDTDNGRPEADASGEKAKTDRPIIVPPISEKAQPPSPPKVSKPESSDEREEETVPMTMLRRTVARRLVEAKQQMAMLTTFNEVDMSAVQGLRKEHQEAFEKRYQVRLGLMSFFVKAAIDALKQLPQLNAEIRGDDIIYRNYFDMGVAIASERGLVVPVLRNAERLSFAGLEQAIGEFARRAKDGKLKPDELADGTFTITNGGVFGSLLSTPIINPPQTGILGLHTIQERPVAVQGQVVIRPMMYLALTYDHRIVDGREAVLFLRRVKEVIETPARMLVEI